MFEWWDSLTVELQIFYGAAIIATTVVALQMILQLVGFDADGSDGAFDVDMSDIDHRSGIGLFSSQTIAAFFLGFGWVGVAAIKHGLSVFAASLASITFGLGAMFGMYFMLRALLKLQSKGNLKYESAIGKEGVVYVTIPGSNKDGGQIQVTFQGRLTTASARKESEGKLKPGDRVRITGVYGQTSFLVEPL